MSIELTPKWKPIPFPFPCAPAGGVLFDPVVCQERAVLVAGGPLALSVFQVFSGKRVWFTVKARVWITGFAVSASSLYVQDGPVLSGWDLTQGGCFAAINLVTRKTWAIPPDATPATQPPADLYVLPAASAALQSALMAARTAPRPSEATLLTAANDSLASATAAGAAVVFSAPVVRSMQFDGLPGGEIFSLGLDGTITALDDALAHVGTFKYEAPLRAELTLSEIPQSAGNVLCHLHYVTATGGIASLDAMKKPLAPFPHWPSAGPIVAAKVLPLRFRDGLLWGGGILGADFFATAPDPAQPLLLTVSAPTAGWRTYHISAADKLVLVSNGADTRLVSYARSSKVRDRWRLRTTSKSAYTVFWPLAGLEPSPTAPRLILEIDRASSTESPTAFRVLLANTVDAPKPVVTPNYPPAAQPLDTGTFGAGAFDTLQKISAFVGQPLIEQQTLYSVVSGKNLAGEDALVLAAFAVAPEMSAVQPQAEAALAALRAMVEPIRLAITKTEEVRTISMNWQTRGPHPVLNQKLSLVFTSGNRDVQTDALGIAELDPALAGQPVQVNRSNFWCPVVESGTTTLQVGPVNTLHVFTSDRPN